VAQLSLAQAQAQVLVLVLAAKTRMRSCPFVGPSQSAVATATRGSGERSGLACIAG